MQGIVTPHSPQKSPSSLTQRNSPHRSHLRGSSESWRHPIASSTVAGSAEYLRYALEPSATRGGRSSGGKLEESRGVPSGRRMRARAVLFDFGGTLVEPYTDLLAAFRAAGRRAGVELPWAEYLRANETLWEELWPQSADWIGRRPSFADEIHARALRAVGFDGPVEPMVECIREEATSPRFHAPFPESDGVLRELGDRGIAAHLVSNNVDYLPFLLERLGWADRFASVTYSQEIAVAKPDPRLFQLALRRAACAAEDAVFVGDSWEADVVGAQRAGIRPIWLNRAGTPLRQGVPMIENLQGVLALLE